jgi:hypothetical protein
MTEDFEGKTLINILIGVVVTLVVYIVPGVQFLAPAVGGGVAGYLQKRGVGGGIKVGVGVAFVSMIPAILLVVVFSSLIAAFVPFVGAGMLAGTFLFVILLVLFFWTLILAVIGGMIGGAVAGESEKENKDADAGKGKDIQLNETDSDGGIDEREGV